MRGVPTIDLSGLQGLTELTKTLMEAGTIVMLTSVQPKVMTGLKQSGLIDVLGKDYIFTSAEHDIVRASEEHIIKIEEMHAE